MLQAGSLCFWLHSDLKGYRNWAWSWTALAEGEWNLTPGEQSQDTSQASRPNSPATGTALRGSQENTSLKGMSGWEESWDLLFLQPHTSTTAAHPSCTGKHLQTQFLPLQPSRQLCTLLWQILGPLVGCNLLGGHRQLGCTCSDPLAGLRRVLMSS